MIGAPMLAPIRPGEVAPPPDFLRGQMRHWMEQVVDADMTILIGEDGSTDGTLAICAEYAAKDPRVHVFARDKNRPKVMIDGCMTGRANVLDLLMRCDGDYAIRIDGDDRWCDTAMLQKQVDALRKNPSAMGCYHATSRIDHDGRATGKLFNEQLPERMELEDTITHLSPFHVSSFLYRDGGRFRKPPALAHQVGSLDLLLFALVLLTDVLDG